ncbi:MAG: chromosomal replication initiator protein, partial [Thermomicrobiales bacterium]|nr:chromosomal replication initiator protein [Thermomicrobiales bacterium]
MQMQAKQLWQAVLGDMQVRLSRNAFDNWLRPTTIVGFEDDVATVAAANTFGASTLQARYAGDIERVMSDIVGRPIRVEFTV